MTRSNIGPNVSAALREITLTGRFSPAIVVSRGLPVIAPVSMNPRLTALSGLQEFDTAKAAEGAVSGKLLVPARDCTASKTPPFLTDASIRSSLAVQMVTSTPCLCIRCHATLSA